MSLLVPDYTSSSEDDDAPGTSIAALPPVSDPMSAAACGLTFPNNSQDNALNAVEPTTSKPKKKKKKNSDEDSELLAKHKAAKKAAKKQARPAVADKDSVLSFLPLPKHKIPGIEYLAASVEAKVEKRQEQVPTQEVPEAQTGEVEEAAAAWQQDYQQQHQYQGTYAATSQENCVAQGEDDVVGGSSKRRRTRERDIERALEEGHFETVAGQIAEVHGPIPNAWQPPVDPLTGASGSSDHEVRVKASFWNAQAGTKVSSMKPSRLQRQKHQLNQLAFDAKARDFELQDKRGASLKTKRETYAKYGW
ncbi:unnamed protein product [Peronospora destructor]|uniref:Proline-rich protein PRCC n=1 Tax=Peronospora destructor TaxID=86335 RepID=A0AAV0TS14_9STRA|nr:unnamed protein product [Peronospora destructor]